MRTIVLTLVLLALGQNCSALCSSEYGAEPCKFVPALPGRTPSCARPGFTFCEHPSHYPGHLIKYLIEKWRYDHSTLLSNESPEEFNSYFIPSEAKYGPLKPVYGPPNSIHDPFHPEPIYIPKPPRPALQQPGNTYIPPPLETHHNYSDAFLGYTNRRPHYSQPQELPSNQLYNYKLIRPQENYDSHGQHHNQLNGLSAINQPPSTHYNPNTWWKREARDLTKHQNYLSRKRKRSINRNMFKNEEHNDATTNTTAALRRAKRQSALTGQELCQSRSQYIMPRAALNNKGSWMYVVNMPEVNDRYTQLVKSETCISQQCSGLCGLPAGYTSRCEQKYVQKRLVALEGAGNNLYTDVFWFPSCCVCTISN